MLKLSQQHLLKHPEKLSKFKIVRIWSNEHKAWWRPDGAGYTDNIHIAGIYRLEDAWERVQGAGPEKKIVLVEFKLKKRTWHYIQKPQEYEVHCDKCNGINLDWSEWASLIWCYDCNVDNRGTEGVFGGPIPVNLSYVLGMRFDIWDMKKNRIRFFDPETGKNKMNKKREAAMRKKD